MIRTILSDPQWDRIKDLVPGKATDRGVTGRNNRRFVEAVLWVARTGAPWRDLPDAFGPWYTDDPDFEYLIIDSTIVRAHHHAGGAKGGLKIRPSDARAAG